MGRAIPRSNRVSAPLLSGVAAAFAAMGVVALARPAHVVRYFGVVEITADLRNEIRAVHGGFGIAVAIACVWTAGSDLESGTRFAIGSALFGMAGGRLVSFCVECTGHWPVIFCVIEIVGGLALVVHG
jgi:Domain of unknown function (DUF4345)